MIDELLLAKVSGLSPADRLDLIGKVWDTLSPEDVPVTHGKERCSMRDWRILKLMLTINLPGPRLRPPLNG